MRDYANWKKTALKITALTFVTVMPMECLHCREVYALKDGRGTVGVSSGICPSCITKGFRGYVVSNLYDPVSLALDDPLCRCASCRHHLMTVVYCRLCTQSG